MTAGFQFLGHYLLEQGAATREQIEQAADFQARSNRRLGDLAVEAGLLEPRQVDRVLGLQRETDLSFGQLAVSLGLVTRRDMNDLLFKQQVAHYHLGEAMLTLGHLTQEQFSASLEGYAARERQRERALEAFYQASGDRQAVSGLVAALERAFLRFVRRPLKAQGPAAPGEAEGYPYAIGSSLPLPEGGELAFTLRLSPGMLALAGQAAAAVAPPPGGEAGPAEPVEAVRALMGHVCEYLGRHRKPARDAAPWPSPQAPVEPGRAACLRLACPKAEVLLCLERRQPAPS